MKSIIKDIFFRLIIILIIGIIYIIITENRTKSLNRHRKETTAIVTGFKSSKNADRFLFNFEVDGTKFQGSDIWNPRYDYIEIGDTIYIEYDSTHPKNYRVVAIPGVRL